MRFQNAGVHIDATEKALEGVRKVIRSTFSALGGSVLGDPGGGDGLYGLNGFNKFIGAMLLEFSPFLNPNEVNS